MPLINYWTVSFFPVAWSLIWRFKNLGKRYWNAFEYSINLMNKWVTGDKYLFTGKIFRRYIIQKTVYQVHIQGKESRCSFSDIPRSFSAAIGLQSAFLCPGIHKFRRRRYITVDFATATSLNNVCITQNMWYKMILFPDFWKRKDEINKQKNLCFCNFLSNIDFLWRESL